MRDPDIAAGVAAILALVIALALRATGIAKGLPPFMTTSLDIGNRELQPVERSIQERATLLSTTSSSLRFQDVTPRELEILAGYTAVFLARQGSLIF